MHHQQSIGSSEQSSAVALAIAFVRAVEEGRDAASLLARDALEEEMPNRVFAEGKSRDLAAMRAGVERGKALFKKQSYVIRRALGTDREAALELEWTGELAAAAGALPPGAKMRAQAAFFFDVRDGLIWRIRHYDCFDPF